MVFISLPMVSEVNCDKIRKFLGPLTHVGISFTLTESSSSVILILQQSPYYLPGLNRNLAPGNPPFGLGTLLLTEDPVERAWGLATPSLTGTTDASAACTNS